MTRRRFRSHPPNRGAESDTGGAILKTSVR